MFWVVHLCVPVRVPKVRSDDMPKLLWGISQNLPFWCFQDISELIKC